MNDLMDSWMLDCAGAQYVVLRMWMLCCCRAASLQGCQSAHWAMLTSESWGIGTGYQQCKQNIVLVGSRDSMQFNDSGRARDMLVCPLCFGVLFSFFDAQGRGVSPISNGWAFFFLMKGGKGGKTLKEFKLGFCIFAHTHPTSQ